jgi:broad specificity phosphatase PhoE
VGTVKHGLTVEGRLQARRAATRLVDLVGRDRLHALHFYSSDFTRAWQTADETLSAVRNLITFESAVDNSAPPPLAASGVTRSPLLRERWFGSLDGTELKNYQQVWPRDLISAEHSHGGVESVSAVSRRVRELILQLEAAHDGCSIVLVSHADTLQIMQVYVAGGDARTFSQYRFTNGEVRELRQEQTSLPMPVPLTYV